ncbi:hydrolase, putative [Mycolicibacterium smegmatis MKD8]|uniref:Hydrolase, putative n=1 Tax=Mycolicibacterium smegmatis (strain MKD8) TaxID=1214915 RepID=A0A2U9PPY3_MYCSE|nr:hydrolase, putative [Mycolicibacterium smegmatis MKD8]
MGRTSVGDNGAVGEKLVVAAVQPRVLDGDVEANVASHAEAIVSADARLVVFPELSLTGYRADAQPVDLADGAMERLVKACAATRSIALIGAPVETSGGRFIAMVRVDAAGVNVVYRKTFLSGEECRHFAAGDGPRAIEVDGWQVGMGICRDTGIDEHVRGTAALGVDVYVCGVVHHETELAEQQRRGRSIAAVCDASVVMASFAGSTGGGFTKTAGRSAIWATDGTLLAEADACPGGMARTTLERSATENS